MQSDHVTPRRLGPGAVGETCRHLPRHLCGDNFKPCVEAHHNRRGPGERRVLCYGRRSGLQCGPDARYAIARNCSHCPTAVGLAAIPLQIHVSGPTAAMVGKLVVFSEMTNPASSRSVTRSLANRPMPPWSITQARPVGDGRKATILGSRSSLFHRLGRPSRAQVQCRLYSTVKACCRFTATSANGQSVDDLGCLEIAAVPPSGGNPLACGSIISIR